MTRMLRKLGRNTYRMVRRWSWKKRFGVFVVFLVVFTVSTFLFKVEKTFSLINPRFFTNVFSVDNEDDYQETDRTDILILGYRGEGGAETGEYLTDTIMVLSLNDETGETALFSIPRDLYVRIAGFSKMEKINVAYVFGLQAYRNGLELARRTVERVSGIDIDYTIAVDFSAFTRLIDMVGGIDVYVPYEFVEATQWGFEFRVPKGMQHMDSETALYYARSRFSSSDFDRARRQRDIMLALANKVTSLGVLGNPLSVSRMVDTLSDGIDTDIDFISLLNLIKRAKDIDQKKLPHTVFDDNESGLLAAGYVDRAYVLYPKAGIENYSDIKETFRTVFDPK